MLRCMNMLARTLLVALLSLVASPVAAQQMGQGEARITSRSDVRLSMESMPGTSGAMVTLLGQRVGARMAQVRGCYEERIEEDPTVTGTLRLRWLLEGRGRPRVEVDQDGVNDATVLRCITRVLSGIETAQLTRPTRAIVQLQLANSAARGAERAAVRAQEAQQVALTTDANGNPQSTGGTPDGRVRFTITGRGRNAAQTVAAAHRAVLTSLPGLMDCRRRSARLGRAPGGDLSATMQVRTGRAPTTRVTRSTVPNERTRGCVSNVMGRIEHRPTEGNGNVAIEIHFEPADAVEEAQDE